MEQEYLLLYKNKDHSDYAWFFTEEGMRDFAKGYEVFEAWHIKNATEIDLQGVTPTTE